MQRLEDSSAVRSLYGSLGVKGLNKKCKYKYILLVLYFKTQLLCPLPKLS